MVYFLVEKAEEPGFDIKSYEKASVLMRREFRQTVKKSALLHVYLKLALEVCLYEMGVMVVMRIYWCIGGTFFFECVYTKTIFCIHHTQLPTPFNTQVYIPLPSPFSP